MESQLTLYARPFADLAKGFPESTFNGVWLARLFVDDKLGAGGSHIDFPKGVDDIERQLEWSLNHIRKETKQLLEEAGYPDEAKSVDSEMLNVATYAIEPHLQKQGDLRRQAIAQGALRG